MPVFQASVAAHGMLTPLRRAAAVVRYEDRSRELRGRGRSPQSIHALCGYQIVRGKNAASGRWPEARRCADGSSASAVGQQRRWRLVPPRIALFVRSCSPIARYGISRVITSAMNARQFYKNLKSSYGDLRTIAAAVWQCEGVTFLPWQHDQSIQFG